MCCWWTKPKPEPPPPAPRAEHLAMAVSVAPTNSSNTTDARGDVQYLCQPPAEFCPSTSRKFSGYCENGVCCHLGGQEFCACTDPMFAGDRCDILALMEPAKGASAGNTTAIIGAVILIVAVVVIGLIVFVFLRRRRMRNQQSSTDPNGNSHPQDIPLNNDGEREVNEPANDNGEIYKISLDDGPSCETKPDKFASEKLLDCDNR